jgi:hypothetical protein
VAVPADGTGRNWETGIPVTMDGDEENTWFGSQVSRSDIEDEGAGYGICHPQAVEAICRAWQVTIIDPEWGRNDLLWPALEAFAAGSQQSEWTNVGDVTAGHGEILIIANHGVRPSPGDGSPWDRFIGYTVVNSQRSPDGTTEVIVADICSPGWEMPVVAPPLHVREEAFIVRTGTPGLYEIDARACGDPGHDGWCELRIRLHRHDDDDDEQDEDDAEPELS